MALRSAGIEAALSAVRGVDGYDHIGMIDAAGGLLDQDYEMFEQQTPHLLIQHEYLCDSAGPGKWRGGLGVETKFEIGADNTQLVIFGDGNIEPAFGLYGGKAGSLNAISLRYPDGTEHTPRCLDIIGNVPKGTQYRQLAGGGGGYGHPFDRAASLVAREVRNGTISIEAARDRYGVVVDPLTFQVNETSTQNHRSKHRHSEDR
ncbi:MAG: hydantoinase B/oxoprolinase family protein [Proteobacteria bacterium]|nr:hydantoinase B/oxoprolinase family protein [Pseudomonadota bacterium]